MKRGNPESALFLRTVLVLVVLTDLVWLFFLLDEARQIGIANGALNSFNDLASRTAVRGAVALLGVIGALAFAGRPGRMWAGALALMALVLLNTAHAQLFGSPWRHLFYSGLCLTGWLLGLAVSRYQGKPTDESYACMASLALLAAAYLNAGISKIVYGGIDWVFGLPIQATIVAQDGLVPDSVLTPYRAWVVATPWAAGAFSLATMAFELGAPLMLLGRRTRAGVALGLVSMHASIFALTGILYAEPMVLLLAFGLFTSSARALVTEHRPAGRAFILSVGFLAICAAYAVVHQARRYARSEISQPAAPGPPTAAVASTETPLPPSATATPLREIGPLAVGQSIADGWNVDALELRDTGVVATVSGQRGRIAFELTCAPSPYRSPFDIGELHVFYSTEIAREKFRPVGSALQKIIERAAAGGDPCDRLARWRAASASTPAHERAE
jgi:hypothetical protein